MKKILLLTILMSASLWAAPTNKSTPTNLPKVTTLIPQLLPRNPNTKPPPSPVQKQLEAFFLGVQGGKIDEAFKTLVASNPTLSDPASVPEFVATSKKALKYLARSKGMSCTTYARWARAPSTSPT